MTINIFKFHKRLIALAIIVGALPFIYCTGAYAREESSFVSSQQSESKWLDDYSKPVKLTYNAQAKVQAAYLWRGLYCGAFNTQGNANIGYGGLYFDVWWNAGVTDWTFKTFLPEVDITLGFDRWGLNVFVYYVHNFNCGFFDFTNYPDKGNRLEADIRYTLSSKIPLSILWGTRIAAADSYLNAAGDTIRAYSSYAEISYTQKFPKDWSLSGAVGITPWRSFYTGFQRDFAVCNVELRLRKDWTISPHCGMMVQGQLCINPSALAADKSTAVWKPSNPFNQSVNANLTFGVYLIQ